jgi:membrane protein implicated in regulation of membrane protease activity
MDSMVRSETPEPAGDDQSLGDLVALAAKDVSQLVRYEINLAKRELRGNVQRAAFEGALFGFCALAGCLILILLCFAYAYGLQAAGAPGGLWGAFLLVTATVAVLAAIAGFAAWLGWRRLRRLSGMRRTRKTVSDDLAMLRRGKGQDAENADRHAVPQGDGRGGPAQIPSRPAR